MKQNNVTVMSFFMWLFLSFSGYVQAAEKPLELSIYRADETSFFVSSTLVYGKTEAVLVDAQFTLADAHQVVADILRSGRSLTTVYISHGDPDYYFGLEVILQAFPEVKIYTTKKTLEHIKKTYKKKLEFWGPKLGSNSPSKIILPEVLKGNTLIVDGHELKIKGLMKHPESTFIWIPSIKAVLGGVPVYGNLHLWMADSATQEARNQWKFILKSIKDLKPEMVVPGHALRDAPLTTESVDYSMNYIKVFEAEMKKASDSKALIKTMKQKYPESKLGIALDIGAKVSLGEMNW